MLSSWSPFLIALVVVICFIFLVFCYCMILKRLCCAFNAAILFGNQVESQVPDESNSDNNPSPEHQNNALESSAIHSLPISQFKKVNKEEPPWVSNTDCAVCLGEFEEGEWLKHLPNCTHAFHISCIDTWFESHSSCPLCRSSVSDQTIQPEISVSVFTIPETLGGEDLLEGREAHYQMLRSEYLRNSVLRYETTSGLL